MEVGIADLTEWSGDVVRETAEDEGGPAKLPSRRLLDSVRKSEVPGRLKWANASGAAFQVAVELADLDRDAVADRVDSHLLGSRPRCTIAVPGEGGDGGRTEDLVRCGLDFRVGS